MHTCISSALMLWISLLVIEMSSGQDTAIESAQTNPPAASGPDASRGQTTPLPGEDVMRPVEHGVRMTPVLARALARSFVSKFSAESLLTQEQKGELNARLARRIMDTARAHQELLQAVGEYGIETLIRQEIRNEDFTVESSREFGRRLSSATPVAREFLKGLVKDFQPVLDAEQDRILQEIIKQAHEALDQFEARMNRWADGEYADGEDPFGNPSATVRSVSAPSQMQRAEQNVANFFRTLEPTTWEPFVVKTAGFFDFDDGQMAEARRVLTEYQAKADEIMTPEWKNRVRENRLKDQFYDTPQRKWPVLPWSWRLQYDFNQAMQPLRSLDESFRKEILALATDEQRQAVLSVIRQRAGEHGLVVQDADRALLELD